MGALLHVCITEGTHLGATVYWWLSSYVVSVLRRAPILGSWIIKWVSSYVCVLGRAPISGTAIYCWMSSYVWLLGRAPILRTCIYKWVSSYVSVLQRAPILGTCINKWVSSYVCVLGPSVDKYEVWWVSKKCSENVPLKMSSTTKTVTYAYSFFVLGTISDHFICAYLCWH